MCGICGTYGFVEESVLKGMCDALTHRGPDAEGFYTDSKVSLAMRRLKVIDLDTGNQPIYNEDRSTVVVYNGEIYNFNELREDLEKQGHSFATKSDTEVIAHLYEEYGDGFISKLRGMFAFALWDSKCERLLLARDRIGIKPLYYYCQNGVFAFSSEIKSLLWHPEVPRNIDYDALYDYLTFMYVPAPATIFEGIQKLLPGHYTVYEKGALNLHKYWEIPGTNLAKYNGRELSEMLLDKMLESVNLHLTSDVPLGVFLSGGTDSGAITALATEILGRSVKSFSVGFKESEFNELANARLVARRYGTDHHEYIVDLPDIDVVEDILSSFGEPFADSSAIPTYFVSRCARREVTVALSGDGGDEVFGGYGNYKADKITQVLRKIPGFVRNGFLKAIPSGQNNFSALNQIKKLLGTANLSPEKGHVYWLNAFSDEAKRSLLGSEYNERSSLERYGEYFNEFSGDDFINTCMNVDMKTVLADDYLQKVDRMSMANSLEVRVPFLDHEIVEFCVSLPSKYKLRGLKTKYLFKKTMRSRLPEEIIKGKKKGFSIPLSSWFKQDFSVLISKYLSKGNIQKRGIFNWNFVEKLSREHLSGKKDNSKILWTLICFEIWSNKYMDVPSKIKV